jgi:hypothetical protein
VIEQSALAATVTTRREYICAAFPLKSPSAPSPLNSHQKKTDLTVSLFELFAFALWQHSNNFA